MQTRFPVWISSLSLDTEDYMLPSLNKCFSNVQSHDRYAIQDVQAKLVESRTTTG